MKYKNKINISLVLMIILTMVLSPFSSFALEGDYTPSTVTIDTKNMSPQEKIQDIVKEKLNQDESVEVIVYLNEKVNVQELTNKANYMSTEEKREMVVDTLKYTAESSQRDLINFLESEVQNGNVDSFEPYYIINAIHVKGNKTIIEELSKREDVYKISYNEKVKAETKSNVNAYETNAATNSSTDQTISNVEWGVERIGAPKVWEKGIDGSGVVVGVIDSGADWTHEALRDKWRGYNPNDTDNPNPEGNWYDAVNHKKMPYDETKKSHGTHILGTVLGQDKEGKNKIGVAPGAQWIAAKAFDEESSIDSWLIAAGQWMLAPNGDPNLAPDIVLLAPNTLLAGWGDVHKSNDEWFRDMVIAWKTAGIIPVFGAGDNWWGGGFEGSIETPASYPESFAVGGVDENNELLWSTNRGPAPYQGFEMKPNIVAPGSNTRSSIIGGYEGGSNWVSASNAAAHAAGAVALLLSADNTLNADDIEQILETTAKQLIDSKYTSSPNYGYGHGLLNIDAAISSISTDRATVKGKVTVAGTDTEDPQIVHEQEVKLSFSGQDIVINANVSDDNAVAKVELMVKQDASQEWTTIPMNKVAGTYENGQYKGTIDSTIALSPGIIYKIVAIDSTGKTIETSEYNIEIKFGMLPNEYNTGFETEEDIKLWSLSGDWEWGQPKDKPTPHEGSKVVGTKIDGKYSRSSDSYLISPPFDLRSSELKSASLRFNHWYDTKLKLDFCNIYISNDYGQTWNKTESEFSGRDYSWSEVSIDFKNYLQSETPVFVAFRFTSDTSWTEQGWYIDNVRLIGNDEEAPKVVTGFSGEFKSVGAVLKWDASKSADLSRYNIYRKTSDTEYSLIGTAKSPAYVDDTVEKDNTYNYIVKAVDIYENESLASEEVEVIAGEVKAIYFESFEDNDGGYKTGGQKCSWEWGVPLIDHSSWGDPGPESAYFGDKLWGTDLMSTYKENSSGYIETPSIDIPSDGEYMLDYYQWIHTHKIETDRCQVQISTDDSKWINITPNENMGGEIKVWENIKISLKDYSGQSVKFRFVLYADEIRNAPGWYIDNVCVVKSDGEEVSPGNVSVSTVSHSFNEYETDEYSLRDLSKMTLNLRNVSWGLNENFVETIDETTTQVPVEAIVTIVETGIKVRTSTRDGSYKIDVPVMSKNQKVTLRVEANGYATQEVVLNLNNGQVVEQNFSLIPASKGNIDGKVVDSKGEAIVGAQVKISNSSITPVKTGDLGEFKFNDLYEGKYTLLVSAKGKTTKQVVVDIVKGKNEALEIVLDDYVGHEKELIYDDGSAENELTASCENSGIAVRMTPNGKSILKGAKLYFKSPEYEGFEIGIAIYDSFNGSPGMMIGEPKYITPEYDKWNYVDLSEYEFTTEKDFFIATYQKSSGDCTAPLGIDNDGEEYNRSYVHKNGGFVPFGEGYKNAMIRAIMTSEIGAPTITNLKAINYTNKDNITVEGTVSKDSLVKVYQNGQMVKEVQSNNGTFKAELELTDDVNEIYATSIINEVETNKSNIVKVILDKILPNIKISSPENDNIVNEEKIVVSGIVTDKYLAKVYVNNQVVEVDESGNFETEIYLNLGENTIVVKAKDNAGNVSEVTRNVYRNQIGQSIKELPINTIIVDNEAFDVRYLNSNVEAKKKLINWYNSGKEVYIKLNRDLLVNSEGIIITIEKLPNNITYYSVNGEIFMYAR